MPTHMASADSSSPIPPSYDDSSTEADEEVSQGKTRDLHPITHRIYTHPFRMTMGLWNPMLPRPEAAASYTVPVRRAGTLPTASFRFHLAMDTLAVQLTIPVIRARKGLSPPVIRQAPHLPEQRYRATHYAWRTSGKGRHLTAPPHTTTHARRAEGSATDMGQGTKTPMFRLTLHPPDAEGSEVSFTGRSRSRR